MNKTALLTATTAIALIAGAASGATLRVLDASFATHRSNGATMLYNQNSNGNGIAIVSQNFSRTDSNYDCAAADDFAVPSGQTWRIAEVDVSGLYFTGSGAGTANVTFYGNRQGVPGKIVRFLPDQGWRDDNGSFSIVLGRKVRLKAGRYWVSVVSNGPSWAEWGWEMNGTVHGKPAMWENPGGGFGVCPTWGTIGNCLGYTGDFMFDLKGRSS